MRATREDSHALATVLREDDVVDHAPIRRGQMPPHLLSLAFSAPCVELHCSELTSKGLHRYERSHHLVQSNVTACEPPTMPCKCCRVSFCACAHQANTERNVQARRASKSSRACMQGTSRCTTRGSSTAAGPTAPPPGGTPTWWPSARPPGIAEETQPGLHALPQRRDQLGRLPPA